MAGVDKKLAAPGAHFSFLEKTRDNSFLNHDTTLYAIRGQIDDTFTGKVPP